MIQDPEIGQKPKFDPRFTPIDPRFTPDEGFVAETMEDLQPAFETLRALKSERGDVGVAEDIIGQIKPFPKRKLEVLPGDKPFVSDVETRDVQEFNQQRVSEFQRVITKLDNKQRAQLLPSIQQLPEREKRALMTAIKETPVPDRTSKDTEDLGESFLTGARSTLLGKLATTPSNRFLIPSKQDVDVIADELYQRFIGYKVPAMGEKEALREALGVEESLAGTTVRNFGYWLPFMMEAALVSRMGGMSGGFVKNAAKSSTFRKAVTGAAQNALSGGTALTGAGVIEGQTAPKEMAKNFAMGAAFAGSDQFANTMLTHAVARFMTDKLGVSARLANAGIKTLIGTTAGTTTGVGVSAAFGEEIDAKTWANNLVPSLIMSALFHGQAAGKRRYIEEAVTKAVDNGKISVDEAVGLADALDAATSKESIKDVLKIYKENLAKVNAEPILQEAIDPNKPYPLDVVENNIAKQAVKNVKDVEEGAKSDLVDATAKFMRLDKAKDETMAKMDELQAGRKFSEAAKDESYMAAYNEWNKTQTELNKQKAVMEKILYGTSAGKAVEPDVLKADAIKRLEAERAVQEQKADEVDVLEQTETGEKVGEGIREGKITSVKNAQTDIERQNRGLPPAIPALRKAFGESMNEAMSRIENDPSYQDVLIASIKAEPRAVDDADVAAILHRQVDLQNQFDKAVDSALKNAEAGREDLAFEDNLRVEELSNKLMDVYEVDRLIGTETARALSIRRMLVDESYTLAKMVTQKRLANNGEKLTASQANEIVSLHKIINDLNTKLKDYETRATQKSVDEFISKKTKAAPKKREVVLAEIRAERGEILKRLASKVRVNAGIDLSTLPEMVDLVQSHVKELTLRGKWAIDDLIALVKQTLKDAGINADDDIIRRAYSATKIQKTKVKMAEKAKEAKSDGEELSDESVGNYVQKIAEEYVAMGVRDREALVDAVQEDFPDMTRQEVSEAISGYGRYRKLSKDEIKVIFRDLKAQLREVSKIEDLQAGETPKKTGFERQKPSDEESRLIREVNRLKKSTGIGIDPDAPLKAFKKRAQTRITEFEKRLRESDFAKKERKPIALDKEAIDISHKLEEAKRKFEMGLLMDKLSRRSIGAKVYDTALEVANTSRALITGLDLSAPFRQGWYLLLSHPILGAKAFPKMFKVALSERNLHEIDAGIKSRENFHWYQRAKLELTEHGHSLSKMEEAFRSRWAEHIPLIAGSQRAYMAFLNVLRADVFDALAKSLSKNRELTLIEAKAIANYVNVASGRGKLNMTNTGEPLISTVFFAPRYVASRFQLLLGQPMYGGTATTRRLIAKEYAKMLIGQSLVYALTAMGGYKVSFDPDSPDFGKIDVGNKTAIDPLAGVSQTAVILNRIGRATLESVGAIKEGKDTRKDLPSDILRFLRFKLAPIPATAMDVASKKTAIGEPVSNVPAHVIEKLTVPISLGDILKAMEENGIPKGTALGILAIFGMGLQVKSDRKKTTKYPITTEEK